MAAKIGGFLGVFVGFIVWRWVGGIWGLLLAVFLVVPLASAAFIGLFSMMGGGEKETRTEPQAESQAAAEEQSATKE